ncbi:nucleotidyltransferase domain-containing protein [Salinispora cortesiana]|uniref:nucleotidyltransferase domain-containing protein n=1 Tax=Salinispora cortesiana TaxID=1305843 RepID=UPI000369490F|nr:nucleotidyltransferase domain-containing protein [Salinispora cortesiana]
MKLAPIRRCLQEHLGTAVSAAFVYGSVATGRDGPGSDLDCFVLTRWDLDGPQRRRAQAGFAALQRALGFTPDCDYPVELFSTHACRAILEGSALAAIIARASTCGIAPHTAQSDETEVLRSLLDQRLVVTHSSCLDQLTEQARALVRRTAHDPSALLRALGLDRAPQARI